MSKKGGVSKGRLITSSVFFFTTLAAVIFGAYLVYKGHHIIDDTEQDMSVGGYVIFVYSILGWCISHLILTSWASIKFREMGAYAKIIYIVTFIPFWLIAGGFGVVRFIVRFIFRGLTSMASWENTGGYSSKSSESWELRDENGSTRTLEQSGTVKYENGKEYKRYRDDLGNSWLSSDGENFHRDK